MKTFHHALIIGASSGIGAALARRLAAEGTRVALVARRGEALERIAGEIEDIVGEARAFPFPHDVTHREEVPALFEEITRTLGGLDLVIYAAGLMTPVAFEEYDTAKDTAMVEVNLLGAMAWLNPAAQRFFQLGQGTIVGIGSIAGDRGRSGSPAYNTSKAALATYLEALRNRVARRRVKVVTLKPGFVETPMTHGLPGMFWLITADRAAEIILGHIRRGSKNAYVPARWRLVSWVIRSIPSFLFRRLKI
jgi:decaprenylphospho-beta-D-erythro-pentofuranosid-2-ulose 2-reductase